MSMVIKQKVTEYNPTNSEEIVLRFEDNNFHIDVETKDVKLSRKINKSLLLQFLNAINGMEKNK